MIANNLPPFVKVYTEGDNLVAFNSGHSVNAVIVDKFLADMGYRADMDKIYIAGFWMIEGYLFHAELDPEMYPSLHYYLTSREGKPLPTRWQNYGNINFEELGIITDGYSETRHHVLETQIDSTLEEKKSA